ncbi:MAG TPA: alpha/beta hydrolase [Acidobacteriaceae bacterium]|jgi:pimeloyl-ACP methyl ester carboxylesterase|nr:alpha/beta hydrolase [Acidobacteriaceae bacterium]
MGLPASEVEAGQSESDLRTHKFARARLLLIIVSCVAIGAVAFSYNYQLLRASVILDHHYEKPIVLRTYERLLGYKVEVSDFNIPGARGPIAMRIYSPIGKRNPPPMVLVHGLVAAGNRHLYMNQVAEHLAKVGFLVALPTLPAESHFEMRPSDVTVITDSIRWTAQHTGQKVTLVGNSFSGGLIVPAAAQPAVAGEVKLIFCNSGYYNLDSIGRYFIHDPVLDPDGKPYQGDPPGPLLIAAEYLDELVPKEDIPDLAAAIDGYHRNDGFELPPSDPVMARLTPREREEFHQIKTADSPEFQRLYLRVLDRHRSEIAAISPSSVLKDLKIPLYVLHSSADPVFPLGEVAWIRKSTEGNSDVHILVSPWLLHVAVGSPATPWQKFQVIDFCAKMLQQAAEVHWLDSTPAPQNQPGKTKL